MLVLTAALLFPVGAKAQQVPDRMWALVIGVSNYIHAKPLQYAADDALAFSDFIKSPRGGGIPEDHVFTLIEDQASRWGVTMELARMGQRVQPGDVVFIYIAGHGHLINRSGYFIPSDGAFDSAPGSAIHLSQIRAMIEADLAHANVRVLITDMCNAGRLGSDPLQPAQRIANELNDELLRFRATGGAFLNLMASGPTEASWERNDLRHGVFTYSLLDALNGKAVTNVPFVTARNVVDYLRAEVPRLTGLAQNPLVNTDFDPNLTLAFMDRPGPAPKDDSMRALLVLQNINRSIYSRIEWFDPRTQTTVVRLLPKDRDTTQIGFLTAGDLELRLLDNDNRARTITVKLQAGRNTLDLNATSSRTVTAFPVQVVSAAFRSVAAFFQAPVNPPVESAVIVRLNRGTEIFLDGTFFANSGLDDRALQLAGLTPGIHQLRLVSSPDREYRFRLRLFPGLHALDLSTGELRFLLDAAAGQQPAPAGLSPAGLDRYLRFEEALREGRLIQPAGNSALDHYAELRPMIPETLRSSLERRLIVSMGNRAQGIILKYIRGTDIKWNASIFEEGAALLARMRQLFRPLPDIEPQRLFFEGRALIERNRYDEAVGRLERTVSLDSQASHALNAIGLAFWQQSRLDGAAQYLQQAIAITPRWNYPRNTLSLIYMEQRRYREAEDGFQSAIDNDPEDSTAHHGLAQLYLLLNRRDESEARLQSAVEFNPGNAYAYETYGKLRQIQGRLPEAEEYVRLAIRLEPDEPAFRATLGAILRSQPPRVAEADNLFRDLASREAGSVRVASALVPFFSEGNRAREADQFFGRALKQSSNDPNIRLLYGGLLLKRGLFNSAERQFRAAVRRNPGNAFALYDLAVAYLSQKKLAEAESTLARAVDADRGFANSYQLRGQVRHAQRRYAEAQEEYRKAFSLSSEPEQQQQLCDLMVEARRELVQVRIDDAGQRAQRSRLGEAWSGYVSAFSDALDDIRMISSSCATLLNSDDLRVGLLADLRDAVLDFDERYPGYARYADIPYPELTAVLQGNFWKTRLAAERAWITNPSQAAGDFLRAFQELGPQESRDLGGRAFNLRNADRSIHQLIYVWSLRFLERREYANALQLMDASIRLNFFCVVSQSPVILDSLVVPVNAGPLRSCSDFEVVTGSDRRAHEIYSGAFAGMGDHERARLYLQALESAGPDLSARAAVARTLRSEGKWQEIVALLAPLVSQMYRMPVGADSFELLAEALCQTGDCARGREVLRNGIRIFPKENRLRALAKRLQS